MNKILFLLLILSFVVYGKAEAVTVQILSEDAYGEINGALFLQADEQSTGTGVIDPFVQIKSNQNVEHAYNTIENGVLDNGGSNNFNHHIRLSNIPVVTLNGADYGNIIPSGDYLEFLLDINQSGSEPLLSLDEIQIFLSDTENQDVETFLGSPPNEILNLADSQLVYRLDFWGTDNSDNWIELNYKLNSGSGSGDMWAYIPASLFSGYDYEYLYLYSRFGEQEGMVANAGFEEWTTRGEEEPDIPIPEPSTMLLLGSGLLGAVALLRRKRG